MTERIGCVPQKVLSYQEHLEWAQKLWERMDRDQSDEITPAELTCDELQDVLRSIFAPSTVGKATGNYGRSEINFPRMLDYCLTKADSNKDGVLSFEEFERFIRFLRNETNPEHIANVTFAMFDLDHTGNFSREEFREIYKFFAGKAALDSDLRKAWTVMDPAGSDLATRDAYVKWLKTSAPACFKQHAPPVTGSPAPLAGGSLPSSRRRKPIHRPAPGMLPPREKRPSPLDNVQPIWNSRFSAKDPSELNLAWRGNQRMKTFFSRPQSLPELHRFYCTYEGFEKNRQKLRKPEPFTANYKLVLSTDSVQMKMMPGASRHVQGGTMRNASGEVVPWAENTPRALIRPVWAPGSLLMRQIGPPAAHLVHGRDADEH